MKTKYDIVIAIDPDVSKSGMANIEISGGYISGAAMSFPVLVNYLKEESDKAKAENKLLVVVVECSWETEHNWHVSQADNRRKSSSKGYDVGRNHETGRKIEEMCEYFGIEVVKKAPLVKCWRGKDGKITADELRKITGYSARSNQEVRDAVLLAWDYAGFPMIMRR